MAMAYFSNQDDTQEDTKAVLAMFGGRVDDLKKGMLITKPGLYLSVPSFVFSGSFHWRNWPTVKNESLEKLWSSIETQLKDDRYPRTLVPLFHMDGEIRPPVKANVGELIDGLKEISVKAIKGEILDEQQITSIKTKWDDIVSAAKPKPKNQTATAGNDQKNMSNSTVAGGVAIHDSPIGKSQTVAHPMTQSASESNTNTLASVVNVETTGSAANATAIILTPQAKK